MDSDAPFYPNRAVKSALAWSSIEQLVRRHHVDHDMRAYVSHPGGGMYFCLHLFAGRLEHDALRWNLEGSSFESRASFGTPRLARDQAPWPERGFYEFCLTAGLPRALDSLEALIGLPVFHGPHPDPKPHVLGLGVIAEVMRRVAIFGVPVRATPGFHDSSGYGGGYADWLGTNFPDVLADARTLGGGRESWASAARCWRLSSDVSGAPSVLVDLRSAELVSVGKRVERLDGWRRYREHGGRVGPVVDWVVERLR